MSTLIPSFQTKLIEAGCDEAGRGCLAGPVYAAAVILPPSCNIIGLDDSKKLSASKREELREIIMFSALAYAIASASAEEIDKINILNASILAMHRAVEKLKKKPEFLAIDGNRFKPYKKIPHQTIVKGDGKYMNIAAASILAKTARDEYMVNLHQEFINYNWKENKGYPTEEHIAAIKAFGYTKHHRKSFHLKCMQMELDFG